MFRFLFTLLDGRIIKRFFASMAVQALAAMVALIALLFFLAAAFQTLVETIGGVHASLVFGGLFIIIAAVMMVVASQIWKSRPKQLVPLARYGVMTEALEVAKVMIRKDPSKAIIAGVVLGAMAEFMAKSKK